MSLPNVNIIINKNDPVCMVPPFIKHVGNIIKIGNWWRFWPIQHYPAEVCKSLDNLQKNENLMTITKY